MSEEKIKCKVTDTKQDILKAYKSHLDEINAKSTTTISTAESAKQKAVQSAIATAKSVQPTSIEEQAMLLQKNVITQIREVVDGLAERKAKFDELDAAIVAKNQELSEVFGIEKEANALSALIEAQRQAIITAEADATEIVDNANMKAAEIISASQLRASELDKQTTERRALEEVTRKRQAEEYNYTFERKKMQRENELNDQLALKERSLDAREEAVLIRESNVTQLEAQVTSLADELATLRAAVDQQIKDAVEKAKKDAERSAAIQLNIVSSKHESEMKIKDNQITSLEARCNELKTTTDCLRKDLDSANSKVQEVALQALRSQAEAAKPIVFGAEQQSSKK
jgi:hypothetical protein